MRSGMACGCSRQSEGQAGVRCGDASKTRKKEIGAARRSLCRSKLRQQLRGMLRLATVNR